MEKKIEDYISMYIGCEILIKAEVGRKINLGLYYPDVWTKESVLEPNGVNVFYPDVQKVYAMNFGQVTLCLRPLSSMTEEEYEEYNNIFEDIYKGGRFIALHHDGKGVFYLLSKSFDLFGLIESNLAFDATKITIELQSQP